MNLPKHLVWVTLRVAQTYKLTIVKQTDTNCVLAEADSLSLVKMDNDTVSYTYHPEWEQYN